MDDKYLEPESEDLVDIYKEIQDAYQGQATKKFERILAVAENLETHLSNKFTAFDETRQDSRIYIGHPLGEYYRLNPDYKVIRGLQSYYHLPLEYDCCSECQEDFPHRIHNSEQSFQEELTDNFRVFLPNFCRNPYDFSCSINKSKL